MGHKITLQEIAESFGADQNELVGLYENFDLSYDIPAGDELQEIILHVLKVIESDTQLIGSKERKQVWHNGWAENLKDFRKEKSLDAVIPKFFRTRRWVRFNQQYIKANNDHIEIDYFSIFSAWFFKKYLSGIDNFYEFGCGSGINLVKVSQLFPRMNIVGLDFVQSAVDLINEIASEHSLKMSGKIFDMIEPDLSLKIEPNSAVLTLGAIEQLAGKFYSFVDYLIEQKPSIVIFVEPTIELYDPENLPDYLAIQFHKKRGYSVGLLPYLKKLAANKRIELMKFKRLYLSGLYLEGYTYMIWKPI